MWHLMFLGEYKQAIDEKGELLLPGQFLVELTSGLVVTRGFERNLMLFQNHGWHLLAHKIMNRPLSMRQSRALRRRIFSSAAVLKVDQQGCIQLPISLCEFAGLEGQVMLTGMFDYLEIWNPQMWQPVQEAVNRAESSAIWETIGV